MNHKLEKITPREFEVAESKATNSVHNISNILDALEAFEITDSMDTAVESLKFTIAMYMCEYQTNYATMVNYITQECTENLTDLFDFGEEVDIDKISDGIDRFDHLSNISTSLSKDMKRMEAVIIKYKIILNSISDVLNKIQKDKEMIER